MKGRHSQQPFLLNLHPLYIFQSAEFFEMLEKMQVSTLNGAAAHPQVWRLQGCGSQYQEVAQREGTLSPNDLGHFTDE